MSTPDSQNERIIFKNALARPELDPGVLVFALWMGLYHLDEYFGISFRTFDKYESYGVPPNAFFHSHSLVACVIPDDRPHWHGTV